MWKSYLLSGLRNLLRNPLYSAINVFGFAIGITGLLLVTLHIQHELSYEAEIASGDQLYRVSYENGGSYSLYATTQFGDVLAPKVPGIAALSRYALGSTQIRLDNQTFEEEVAYVESSFFSMFKLPVLQGEIDDLLLEPNSVVFSRKMAQRYLGGSDVVGQTIELLVQDELRLFNVVGVVEPPSTVTRFDAGIYLPWQLRYDPMVERNANHWGIVYSETYVQLEQGLSPEAVRASLAEIDLQWDGEPPWSGYPERYYFQPLRLLHVDLFGDGRWPTAIEASALRILIGIGLVILIMASINFTMLSVGRASARLREVGVRKVLGAARGQVRAQGLLETAMLALAAMAVALLLALLALPYYSELVGRELSLELTGVTVSILALLWLVTVLLAGAYPALLLARLPLLGSLKGEVKVGGAGALRRSLVTLQLAISAALITVTLIMSQQLSYVQSRELGWHGDQVIVLDAYSEDGLARRAAGLLRTELNPSDGVLDVTVSNVRFGPDWNAVGWNEVEELEDVTVYYNEVDHRFLPTMGLELVSGRNFEEAASNLTGSVLINESFAEAMGWEDPLGRSDPELFVPNAQVIGVVRDFHYHDLHDAISPLVLVQDWEALDPITSLWIEQQGVRAGFVMLRLSGENMQQAIATVEETWNRLIPRAQFKFSFADADVQQQYLEDQRWQRTIWSASGLAILLAVLGLVGIAVMQVARRSKEITVRKVLGASVAQLQTLLAREVLWLVLIANLLALPLSWLLMNRWLEDFAYRIEMTPVYALIAALGVLTIALATVSLLSLRATTANPVDNLRSE